MRHLEAPGSVPGRSHICPGSDFQAIKFHNFSVIEILIQPPRIAEGAVVMRCALGRVSLGLANVSPPSKTRSDGEFAPEVGYLSTINHQGIRGKV